MYISGINHLQVHEIINFIIQIITYLIVADITKNISQHLNTSDTLNQHEQRRILSKDD